MVSIKHLCHGDGNTDSCEAPLVYLYSGDPYRPADIGSQLTNIQPEVNFTLLANAPSPLSLDNLNGLNDLPPATGSNVYLTSKVDITSDPSWLHGHTPDSSGSTGPAISCAIIVNDHGNGAVDAFCEHLPATISLPITDTRPQICTFMHSTGEACFSAQIWETM